MVLKFCGAEGTLPIDVLRYIFSFLAFKEITRLETAIVNRSDRDLFLLALRGVEIRTQTFPASPESEIIWYLSRGVILTSLVIEDEYPSHSQLILRDTRKISSIRVSSRLPITSELTSAICQCSNLLKLIFIYCDTNDSEMNLCFRHLINLQELQFFSVQGLSSLTIRSIILHCPRLEYLKFSDIPCVSDNELKCILEWLPYLGRCEIEKVNITDQSMSLLAETNRGREFIFWYDCPRVTWNGKLSYLRQLHLPQLFSDDGRQQLSGLIGFAVIIPQPNTLESRSQFLPIDEFISMGLISRVQVILSSGIHPHHEFNVTIMNMFLALLQCGYSSQLMEIGFVDFMMRVEIHHPFHTQEIWLDSFLRISHVRSRRQLLLSRGILSRLMALPSVRFHTNLDRYLKDDSFKVFELIVKLSREVDWNSAIDENWIRLIPFLLQVLRSTKNDSNRLQASYLIRKIVLKIDDPNQLLISSSSSYSSNLSALSENRLDNPLISYLKITLDSNDLHSTATVLVELRVDGLEVVRHIQTIDPSFLSMVALTWLRVQLEEPTVWDS
jgi:hypothetical protein